MKRFALIFVLVLGGGLAASTTNGIAKSSAVVRPVIGKAVTVPAQPMAGKRFAVSFRVTRSDTGALLTRGMMICDPSVAGKVVQHAESFKGGMARLVFVVPANAKLLKVKLTIKAGGQSATKITTFRVRQVAKPSLSVADVSVAEGNAGTSTLAFPVTLSAASTQTVSVGYATADSTATAGSDYVAASSTLTFKPGETAKTVSVTVNGDTMVEPNETVTVSLSGPVNATIAKASATGTITNDDVAKPRSGHYAGTTSQGRSIIFDIAPDVTSVSNIVVYSDVTCTEVPMTIPDVPLDLTGVSFPIAPDWTFGFNESVSDPATGTGNFALHGALSVSGGATGTLRIDMALNTSYGVVHCSTGDVTWNAP